jgi:hypothetical protein
VYSMQCGSFFFRFAIRRERGLVGSQGSRSEGQRGRQRSLEKKGGVLRKGGCDGRSGERGGSAERSSFLLPLLVFVPSLLELTVSSLVNTALTTA